MISEEEKKAIENLKKNRGVSFKEADVLSSLIDKQQKETEREKQYSYFYKDLCYKQQKEIDKLKSENQIFQRIKNGTTIIFKAKKKYIVEDKINKYYISKDKIREKIKKLENKKQYYIDEEGKHIKTPKDYKISVLKELLKEN